VSHLPSQAGGGNKRLRGAADAYGWTEGYWHHWVRWDMAPFGEWLADDLWPGQLGDQNSLEELIGTMATHSLSYGEVR